MISQNKQTGFTIVELLIVVIIIGILAFIAITAFNGIQQRAVVSTLTTDLKQANTQLNTFAVDNGDLFPEDEEALSQLNGGSGIKFKGDATLRYSAYNSQVPADYCLTAIVGSVVYHVTRGDPPAEGYCADHTPLLIPDSPGIAAIADSPSQITIYWTAIEGAISYNLEWDTDSGFTNPTIVEGITSSPYAATELSQNTTYYFRAYSVNDAGFSDVSSVASATTEVETPGLGPTLSCAVNSSSQITLNWGAVSGANSYTTDRSTASSFTSPTTTTGITSTTQVVTGLSAGIRYYFRVFAVNGSGTGPSSNVVNCITTISAPDSPTVAASIPGSARAWNSGTWAKTYQGSPTSGTWYYAQAAVSSSSCASGTTREQRARIQYNSPTTWGAWTGYTTSSTFYAIGPNTGYGIRFQVQTRCKTSVYTSTASSSSYGCRWRSGSTSCSGF